MDIKHKKEIVAWTECEQIQSRVSVNEVWYDVGQYKFYY